MLLSNIIQQLRDAKGKNEKLRILAENSSNELLKRACYLTYSPRIQFWLKAKGVETSGANNSISVELLDSIETSLCGRKITGNNALLLVEAVLMTLSEPEAKTLMNIINRDLDCGVNVGSINKTWPGLIPEFPVMLAEKNTPKNQKKFMELAIQNCRNNEPEPPLFLAQTKVDGGRFIYVAGEGGYSRAGNLLNTHDVFSYLDTEAKGYVIDGELVQVDENGTILPRQVGNGLYNKAIRGTLSPTEARTFKYIVWDIIPKCIYFGKPSASVVCYYTIVRMSILKNLVNLLERMDIKNIEVVDSIQVSTLEDAEDYYAKQLALGNEGAIVKDAYSLWENDRSHSVIKMKAELEATLLCVGVIDHKKKFGQIGALSLETSDGELQVDVGSGLSNEHRTMSPDEFIGKLINVKYNSVIQSKNPHEKASLFLPIFTGIRIDVTTADSFSKLKD